MSWIDRFKIDKIVKSPCVNHCVISFDDASCKGCGRYPKEIEEWESLTPGEKKKLINELRKRKK